MIMHQRQNRLHRLSEDFILCFVSFHRVPTCSSPDHEGYSSSLGYQDICKGPPVFGAEDDISQFGKTPNSLIVVVNFTTRIFLSFSILILELGTQGILLLHVQSFPQHTLALLCIVVRGVSMIGYHMFQSR